jgi:glycosyltransferase involved in cell wall biosynthesis
MKVLIVHNRYRSDQPSGENIAVERQINLLTAAGHEVTTFGRSSDDIGAYTPLQKVRVPLRVVWSAEARGDIKRTLSEQRPDVVHVHNTFPLISPSVLAPCRQAAAVVASFHNYRLICPQGQLLRHGESCELCVGRVPWPGVVHSCYRDSRVATVPIAVANQTHRTLNVWNRNVNAFIVLSRFSLGKLVAGGLDRSRMYDLPNFAPRPQALRCGPGEHFLFLGRLSAEKAPEMLADVWSETLGPLLIVGDGPERHSVELNASRKSTVKLLGAVAHDKSMSLLARARALILNSRAYEAGPLVVAEALARGIPVIAPGHGAFRELIDDRQTGRLFPPGDRAALVGCVRELLDDRTSVRMGEAARASYERLFTPEAHLEKLLQVYEDARAHWQKHADARGR